MTLEDWAVYGVGEPDEHGVFEDYRIPETLKPGRVATVPGAPTMDTSWLAIVQHWRLMCADLSAVHRVNLWDPTVLALPWPSIRLLIFDLLDRDTRLRAALTRRLEAPHGEQDSRR